ncbi:carbohydrate kinase [Chamaesiphon sp. VAR_48_metabat_135_sub]|uniref:carbohydrate kinase family protein n=1 Tax=Chamaesiphon sp. VAR_48_metabat_135_sub TaxID=2964699 RepID=UPI00286CEDF1|nr:carbohydrate kinase [Chamaesiphon sp. VAR_48_metabat_135_sub]
MSTIICLGEVLFDLLANENGVSSENVKSWTPLPGGAPANVACAVVKMGDRSRFIGCVGKDEAGTKLAEKLTNEGVDIAGIQYHPTAPTRQVQVTRSIDGDRSFGGFGNISTDKFADTQLSQVPVELFIDADFLLLGTISLAYPISAASTWKAVELATEHEVNIMVDINWRPTFWTSVEIAIPKIQQLLAKADYVKFAREEAELIYGERLPQALCKYLPKALGIFVTDGSNICEYWLNGETGQQPAFTVDTIDTTGAGDAFVAGLLHQLGTGQSGAEIVRYASAAGALTTQQAGAIDAQPTDTEIRQFLQM